MVIILRKDVLMKICYTCGSRANDDAAFCTSCGASFADTGTAANEKSAPNTGFNSAYNPTMNNQYQTYGAPNYMADPFDHTSEFSPEDISENKVFAAAVYMLDVFGVIIGLLAANQSKYVRFHVRQALKITVLTYVSFIIGLLLIWTGIAFLAASVFCFILFVVRIIGFIHAWKGQAKELPIIRNYLN